MSIQEGDFETFYSHIPKAIIYFTAFRNSNYANACTLQLVYINSWKRTNHPALLFIKTHFHAFSEEHGEISIARLMFHLRDNNYSGDNLYKFYMETGISIKCFNFLGITRSHRKSSPKKLFRHPDKWSEKTVRIFNSITDIITDIEYKQYYHFEKSSNSYTQNSSQTMDSFQLQTLYENFA